VSGIIGLLGRMMVARWRRKGLPKATLHCPITCELLERLHVFVFPPFRRWIQQRSRESTQTLDDNPVYQESVKLIVGLAVHASRRLSRDLNFTGRLVRARRVGTLRSGKRTLEEMEAS
jgi:hypothetical protein